MIEREVIEDSDACGPGTKIFWCPGCECLHFFVPPRWTWDGSRTAPTVSPSILVTTHDAGRESRCHLFVRSGHLEYLSDCTHALAGQTVAMEPVA